jgi:DNA-binding transcriptional ArsR family regulator
MSTEDDIYNIIFKAMQHPIRRRILRTLSEFPSTYTEIQRTLNIDNGLLNYHLDNMRNLITKDEYEKYTLSEFGKATLNLVRGVEEPASSLPDMSGISMKLLNRLLIACFIIVAMVSAAVIIDLNGRYVDLAVRSDAQGLAITQLQGDLSRLSGSLRVANAELVSSEEAYLVRAALEQLVHAEGNHTHSLSGGAILITTTKEVQLPGSVSGVIIKLVTSSEVEALSGRANRTAYYTLGVELRSANLGVVRLNRYETPRVGDLFKPRITATNTYYLEKKDSRWNIYGMEMGLYDYFS